VSNAESAAPILEARQVVKTYQAGDVRTRAVNEVSLCIGRGEFCVVTGPSGCGKSSLLRVLGLLEQPDAGEIVVEGVPVSRLDEEAKAGLRNRTIGIIFQSFLLIPELTVLQNVEFPLTFRRDMTPSKRRAIAMEKLDAVDLVARARHLPHALSGGQQQRVAIARALAISPAVVLADEPTGNLDQANGERVMELLHRINADGTAIMLVTHDPRHVTPTRRHVAMLDGSVHQDRAAA
jgi:putative ABC transport system ATP-binding protein